jgi:hypothetical protein
MKMRDIGKGVVGLTKAGLGIDRASDEVVKRRSMICKHCPYNKKQYSKTFNANVSKCTLCGCYIKAKVLLNSEVCPDNPPRWFSEN